MRAEGFNKYTYEEGVPFDDSDDVYDHVGDDEKVLALENDNPTIWMEPNLDSPQIEFSPHAVRHKRGPGCELPPACIKENN